MEILENVSLADHTTLHLGGVARFFVSVHSVEELRQALLFAEEKGISPYVLGGGSNVLFSDEGWSGLIIQIKMFGRAYEEDSKGDARVTVHAGEIWDQLVEETVRLGLWGLENLSRIPGTVGAAPVQNIGSYGVEIKDVLDWVEALNIHTKELHIFSVDECAFGYRDSIFKHREGKDYIVTRVAFRLSTHPNPKIEYKDLREHFGARTDMSVCEIRDAVNEIRERKFPNLTQVGTAGSFFKNPVIGRELHKTLETWLDAPVPSFDVDEDHVKVPLAFILEKMGWKGKRVDNMGCWEQQPLVLVHFGGGTASELILFAQRIMKEVKEQTTIKISPEVNIVTNK
jgi:UDP-N-acetylmuramate dehydrogenase